MNRRGNHSALLGIAALTLSGAAAAGPISGQAAPVPTASAPRAPRLPARRLAAQPAGKIALHLKEATDVLVLADRTVETVPVTVDLPAGSLEDTLARIAAAMPKGTVVKKVYLAAPSQGWSMPEGSQVAALAAVQEALSGPPGAPLAPGEVNLLGRRVSAEKAAPVIAALDLKPVYVLTNPLSAEDPVQKMSAAQFDALQQWIKLTPEQQQAFGEQQFNTLINMDPALRQQFFGQQRRVAVDFIQRLRSLPAAQREQFMRDVMGPEYKGPVQNPPQAPGDEGGNGAR